MDAVGVNESVDIGGFTTELNRLLVEHSGGKPYHRAVLTDFAHWYPLSEAASRAPEGPGVYQVKVRDGLLSYPTGKSAMVCYGSSDALRTAVAEVAAQHPDSRFLCRHQSTAAPAVLLDFVLGQFVRRFGSAPTWPSQAPAQAEEQDVP